MAKGHRIQSFHKKNGFTIVELLIVIVVIGILAAITIVSFNGVTAKANDTAVKSDLANISKKSQAYAALNGHYPNSVSDLADAGLRVSAGSYMTGPNVAVNVGYCTKGSGGTGGFAVFAMSKSGNRYVVTESNGVTDDTTGKEWIGTTSTLGTQCGALGYGAPFTHGYVSTDTTTGPWRAWTGA